MSDPYAGYQHFKPVRVRMDLAEFRKLPRHPSYKLEYWDGHLRIKPRWRTYRLALDLRPPGEMPLAEDQDVARIRPLRPTDWDAMPYLFAHAFRETPPFAILPTGVTYDAGREFLRGTRQRVDGPLVAGASMVAEGLESGELVGAMLVTSATEWGQAQRHSDQATWPTLAWAMVEPACGNRGVGMALLAAVTRVLWDRGHRELRVSVDQGNAQGIAFYWRCGFRLLPSETSDRRRRNAWREGQRERDAAEERAGIDGEVAGGVSSGPEAVPPIEGAQEPPRPADGVPSAEEIS
jgi:ribosomal protein S18 acetylase RimI-like enzyme